MNARSTTAVAGESELTDLARRSLGALKWNYLGAGTKVLSQLAIGIMLARLLGPKPFGQIAIAWVILGLGNLIADSGLSVALIQKRNISPRDVRYVFSLQISAGLFLTLLTSALAQWIALFFKLPDTALVLRYMGLMFVIQSFGQTSSSLLRRNLDHKRVQLIQVITYLTGYLLIGLPLAYGGFGVWSLVIAQLTQGALSSGATYLSMPHSLMLTFRPDQPGLLRFGSKVLGSNLTSWGIANFDAVIIARLLGDTNLGLYSRSMSLMSSPMNATVSTLQGVLFPLFSRLQNRKEAAGETYLAALCLMLIALAPIFTAIATIPQTTVLALYGPAWISAAALITPLALAMPVHAALALGGPLMLGLGHPGREAFVQLIGLAALLLGVTCAASVSLAATAWVVFAVYCLRALLVTRLATSLASVASISILRSFVGPVILASVTALTNWQIDEWLQSRFHHNALRLIIDLSVTGTVYLSILIFAGPRLLCAEARALLLNLRAHVPNQLTHLLCYFGA